MNTGYDNSEFTGNSEANNPYHVKYDSELPEG